MSFLMNPKIMTTTIHNHVLKTSFFFLNDLFSIFLSTQINSQNFFFLNFIYFI